MQWIKGYEGKYYITKQCEIFSFKHKKMSQTDNGNGYLCVALRKEVNKKKTVRVHRIIAQSFIENPNNYPIINHKNGIKTDNRLENLEWCSYSGNNQHAYDTGLHLPKSGFRVRKTHIYWNKLRRNWVVRLRNNGVTAYIGSYKERKLAEEIAKSIG
jgi:hypothetical protein